MNHKEISCNECGELLKINNNIHYLVCNNCNAQLRIVRTPSITYTHKRVANLNIQEPPTNNNSQADFLKIRAQIDLLDQEWQNRLPLFMHEGTLPTYSEESKDYEMFGYIIFSLVLTLAGFFMALLLSSWAVILGVIGLISLIRLVGIYNIKDRRLSKFKSEKLQYELKRKKLLKQLEKE